ncbi:MAG: hypothetical protein ACRDRU_17065 [Pseudonocardiaceae bacterium]
MRAPHVFAEQWADGTDHQTAQTRRWLHLFHAVRPDVVTVRYNLLSPLYRPQETDIFDFTLLRDPTTPPRVFSPDDHRSRDPQFHPTAIAETEGPTTVEVVARGLRADHAVYREAVARTVPDIELPPFDSRYAGWWTPMTWATSSWVRSCSART